MKKALLAIAICFCAIIYLHLSKIGRSLQKYGKCLETKTSSDKWRGKIHDQTGKLLFWGSSQAAPLRFDRRILHSGPWLQGIAFLKEHEQFEFFADGQLIQLGLE